MITFALLVLAVMSPVTVFLASGSSIDCSVFSTEEEIFASLPFPVSIQPSSPPTCGSYALFNEDLKIIELTLCNEKSIPLAIFCLQNLKKLVLKNGNLTIPAEIGQLKSTLTYLSVSNEGNTGMTDQDISPEIFNLIRLETLTLHNCGLTTLPETIQQLVNLTTLTLTKNRLATLPTSMKQLSHLWTLDVSDNLPLTSLDSLNGKSINFLTAKNCSIDHLPRNIRLLVKFDLSNNRLVSLDGVETLGTSTDIFNKQIGIFWFNDNQIESIPAAIRSVPLVELHLRANKLTSLPEEIFKIKSLQQLNVQNNRFSEKKREWIAGEARAIRFALSI